MNVDGLYINILGDIWNELGARMTDFGWSTWRKYLMGFIDLRRSLLRKYSKKYLVWARRANHRLSAKPPEKIIQEIFGTPFTDVRRSLLRK